ncbi:MAG: circularly permuted type 2 ATP-grasp protein [Rhodobacterales bacterium]|nr:MAG: circularly permuted type 2 ATP-grasp protein [Rhodobacterales bacterium]
MYQGTGVRPPYARLDDWVAAMPQELRSLKQAEAEALFRRIGITFAVYGEGGDPDRLIPFDMFPRVFAAAEWAKLEKGIKQRARALNAFLVDVYGRGEIIRAGRIPGRLVYQNEAYEKAVAGFVPPKGVYSHIVGIDIVRTGPDEFFVLEDNCRTPSGVSYMLESREIMMRMFPDLFRENRIEPVDGYSEKLRRTLASVAPKKCKGEPTVVILTPGHFNSAYYEHSLLADLMGVELVEGQDLFVDGEYCWMRTTEGPRRVDVIYRRVDDDFLDPLAFRPTSTLGCAGLLNVYRSGNVALCNAIGTGVADDKSIYPYVPKMIEFYLGEKPILKNVPTYMCRNPEDLKYTLANLKDLVVKEVHGAGGYGMLVGPASTQAEIVDFRAALLANPSGYIAQPTLSLSTCPTYVDSGIAPRHIDLRPFVLSGRQVQMVPGGLTRVALKDGSLVVNSSQGGGTKDTWILEADVDSPMQSQSQSQSQGQGQSQSQFQGTGN